MCPFGYYGNSAIAIPTCTLTCPSFSNEPLRKCVTYCQLGTFKQTSPTNSCVYECASTSYPGSNTPTQPDETDVSCIPCVSPCYECTSANVCTSCVAGYLIHEYTGLCASSCVSGYVIDGNNVCRVCQKDCTQCPNGFFLYLGQCLVDCPLGFI